MRDQYRYFGSIPNAYLSDLVYSPYFLIAPQEASANVCYIIFGAYMIIYK